MDPTFDAKGSTESHPMNGGSGPNSYAQNSRPQGEVINAAKDAIVHAILEKLDITKPQFDPSNPFKIADLGCSTGQNTIIAMQNIVEAVELKYKTHYNTVDDFICPEFQVFFNDHTDNDFNTLFRNLATSRRYFASGVPGSFHGRLFPEKSLHIMHSSYALHWLSKVPDKVKDNRSLAYNKDKIYCAGNNEMVSRAYVTQFERDMGSFLEARAKELVEGGLLLIQMPGIPSGSGVLPSQTRFGLMNELLQESLFDMVKMGFINEEKVQSFNVPCYYPSLDLLETMIQRNNCFTIERIGVLETTLDYSAISPKMVTLIARSACEGLLQEYFGSENMDQLFDIFAVKREEYALAFEKEDSASTTTNLFAIVKRRYA